MYNQLNRAFDADLPADWTTFKESVVHVYIHWINEGAQHIRANPGITGEQIQQWYAARTDLLEQEFPWLEAEVERRWPTKG